MGVEDFCNTIVVTADPNASLKQISQQMAQHHVGCVILTANEGGREIPKGIITDRDIALAMGSTQEPQNIRAEQIMLTSPLAVSKKEGVYKVFETMQEFGVRRLPVTNEDGSLFGIIAADDLLQLLSRELSSLSQIVEIQINKERGIKREGIERRPA